MYPFLHAEKQQQLLSFVQRFYIRKLKRAGNILSSLWFVQPYQLIILYLVVKYKPFQPQLAVLSYSMVELYIRLGIMKENVFGLGYA